MEIKNSTATMRMMKSGPEKSENASSIVDVTIAKTFRIFYRIIRSPVEIVCVCVYGYNKSMRET